MHYNFNDMKKIASLILSLSFCTGVLATSEVVVSLQDQHLYLLEEGAVVADYPVVVGKPETPTPTGKFTITSITKKPTWTVPESIMKGPRPPKAKVIPPGPDNPLGAYFLRLNNSSYGIHGTTAPKLVPGSVSAGCIRMKNRDVSALASMVSTGTKVHIMAGPYEDGGTSEVAAAGRELSADASAESPDALDTLLKKSRFLSGDSER